MSLSVSWMERSRRILHRIGNVSLMEDGSVWLSGLNLGSRELLHSHVTRSGAMETMILRQHGRLTSVLATVWSRYQWVGWDGFELRLFNLAESYTRRCTASMHHHYHFQIMVMFQNNINIFQDF